MRNSFLVIARFVRKKRVVVHFSGFARKTNHLSSLARAKRARD
ncbi:MAG: hypothetical protein U5L45_02580 [Saprospiraceae bacterium]|nr:hypothetical protein [Saprospiraceae bacterium]